MATLVTKSTCGYFPTMLGGYNNFVSGSSSTKSFTNLPPFFKVRIWFRFYKIDSWDSEVLRVYESSNLKFTSSPFDIESNMYTGSQCGGKFDNEKSETIFFEFDENLFTTLTIKIDSSLNGGFSHFAISVLQCHATCKTCSSETAFACLSCYSHATKKIDNSCLCDETYYAVSIYHCITSICTVCTPCYSGCEICTGGKISDCQRCVTGKYIPYIYILFYFIFLFGLKFLKIKYRIRK